MRTYCPTATLVRRGRKLSSAPVIVRYQTTCWWEALSLGFRSASVETALRPRTADIGSCTVPREGQLERSRPHVVGHGRILETHVSWNRDRVLWCRRSIGREENLCTADVELWVGGVLVRLVQGQECRSNQIVSTREILGNRHGEMAIVGDQFLGTPLLSIVIVAVDAEPTIANGLILDGRVDLLHVDFAWPLVTLVNGTTDPIVGPIAILKSYLGARLDTTHSIDTILAVDTYSPLAFSTHGGGFDVYPSHGREVRGARGRRSTERTTCHVITGNAVDRVRRLVIDIAHADASAVSLIDAIDKEVGETSVCVDRLSGSNAQQKRFEDGEMHDFGTNGC